MAISGDLIREARLRAGLSQAELGERANRDRAQIARWERGAVEPSFETLRGLLRACGFDLSTDLVEFSPDDGALRTTRALTPQERLQRMLERRRGG
jgi:transcriptional regulator with XRE-family HTH domain